MKTSVPVASSSSGRYNLRKSIKKKWACVCCIGKDNFTTCKKIGKLEKSKKKLQQPILIKKDFELCNAVKEYIKLSMEKTGIQIPESYARLIKPEHNLRICTVYLYQTQIYPTVENSIEEEAEKENENLDGNFLQFKEDLINQSIRQFNLCIPVSVMQAYLTDGDLKLSILKPSGENNVYDLICAFFEEKKHLLLFENNIKNVLLHLFENIFDQKQLFKNKIEETEYEQKYEEFFKDICSSLQLDLRFLIRFILNLPKWDTLMGNFSKETKRDITLCINELLRYIAEKISRTPQS